MKEHTGTNELIRRLLIALFLTNLLVDCCSAELRIPAFTAYISPDAGGARVSPRGGISRWTDTKQSVQWFGQFRQTGEMTAKVQLRIAPSAELKFKLNIAGQSREVVVSKGDSNAPTSVDFGQFQIASAGYQSISLQLVSDPGTGLLGIDALLLDGPAVADAHFNLQERRNAASVHLRYPIAEDTKIAAFYCEVTAVEDPVATFYMACGWHRGYFGMQVNSPSERRIIFSVWDSGNEAVNRDKVADENRVKLVGKGEGVYAADFGNEGTGGHSHLKVAWRTGEVQRFLVTARPVDSSHTIFSGFWFNPELKSWMLISSWNAPKEGGWLRRPHSFSENFSGSNGHLVRRALFGNQWIRTDVGHWQELTTATFSHDPTGRSDRLDRFMGLQANQFFLSHGGFQEGFTKFGEKFDRLPTGANPSKLNLPE